MHLNGKRIIGKQGVKRMLVSDYKKEARQRLKTRKLRAFRISLCTFAISVLSGAGAYFLPQMLTHAVHKELLVLLAQMALALITFGMLGAMRQGRAAWLYCSACGKEPSVVQFLFWLRKGRGLRAALLYAVIGLRKSAWTTLLCLPGIAVLTGALFKSGNVSDKIRICACTGGAACAAIGLISAGLICQKYALAPILFAKTPQKGVRSAVRGSCFLMDGSCVRLFLLKVSFLPWLIASIAVFPLCYTLPYYQQTATCMLRGILRAHTI